MDLTLIRIQEMEVTTVSKLQISIRKTQAMEIDMFKNLIRFARYGLFDKVYSTRFTLDGLRVLEKRD